MATQWLTASYILFVKTGDVRSQHVQYQLSGVPANLTDLTLTWTVTVGATTISCTVANGRLAVTPLTGEVLLMLDDSDTATLSGLGFHRLKITSPYTKTILEGPVVASS